ncbi:MAG: translocation/assembly module TamB domain-containing protein [Anaeromyxobacteraceae bacterium]
MRKRTAALIFFVFVLALVGATLAVLSTPQAGEELCTLVRARLAAASGEPVRVAACRIRPLSLSVELDGLEVGPEGAPLVAVEALSARLAAVQAMSRQVHLAELRVVRPRVRARIPERTKGGGCDRGLLGAVEVKRLTVEEGSVDLTFAGGARLEAARVDVRSRPVTGALRALAGVLRTTRVEAKVDGLHLVAGSRDVTGTVSADGDLAMDLSGVDLRRLDVAVPGLEVTAEGRVLDLCAPSLDLRASGHGGAVQLFELIDVPIDVAGEVEARGRVRGKLASPLVEAEARMKGFRIGPFTAGDGSAAVKVTDHDVQLDRVVIPIGAGRATGRLGIGFGRPVPLDSDVQLENVDLAELLDRFGITGAWVTTRLDGKAHLAGPLEHPVVQGVLTGEAREFRALTRSYLAGASDPGVLAFKKARLELPARIDLDGLHVKEAKIEVGRGTAVVDASAYFDPSRGFEVKGRGEVDLDALGRVAAVPWRGLAQVELAGGAAPYGNPRIAGRVRVAGFRFLDLDLGTGASDFTYDDFLLRLSRAEGLRGVTRWKGEGVIDLARAPAHVVSSRFEAKGRLRDLFEGAMDFIPSARTMRDAMDGDVEVSGTATGPADALDAEFEGKVGAGTLLGCPFDGGKGSGRIHRGREVRVDGAELRRGDGVLRVAGTSGIVPPFAWDLETSFSGWRLADLGLPGTWAGSASGTARFLGSYEVPKVRFAASAHGAAIGGLSLGALQAGGTVEGERLVVTGGGPGLDLRGEARLTGRRPFEATLAVDLDDAARLWNGAPGQAKVLLRGGAEAQGELVDLPNARARVRLEALEAAWADFRVRAAAPVLLEAAKGRVELAPVTLTGPNTELTLGGSQAPGGELDASASGALDVRLLSALFPNVRRPYGQLRLEAHVGGTPAAPVLVGSGRLDDVGMQLKGSNVTLADVAGDLAFSQNKILFDGLTATVNGGRARLEGELELRRLTLASVHVRGDLDEVPVQVPAYLPATLSGRVELSGTPDASTLGGRIHVVRARYTEDVGIEKAVLELRRKPPPPPRPYDKAGEWLRLDVQIAVDGDVRIENDLVRGPVTGDLLLTGTLAAPGLLGSLAMADGSRAVFRGNEFDLSHAVVEFTGRNKVELALDAHGEAQVRDYQVFMHIFGSMEKPQLTLTSSPALSEPDIITLLSLGFTRRDAAAGDGMAGVATAAAAQALVSASGLDEQVRRFLPRNGVLRDFSVRITSAYSEGTGQVEPRAEFESYLMKDRLRLRYQAPLGAARGQRAQAELKLGSHTALQYQWENDNPDVATGDHGLDLKLRWEWTDR